MWAVQTTATLSTGAAPRAATTPSRKRAHELSGGVFYFLLFPPDLGRGQLWHDQIGGRAEQAGGEKQQRQDHTLDDAVTRQRRVGRQVIHHHAHLLI